MTLGRRAGAPRLIEWTGERCVPWAPDTQVVYEHLHRYLWAAELVRGRRVLDLASGEGFGAAILGRSATSVVGIDVDPTTVAHSQLNYGGGHIEFAVGDALNLSGLEAASFDAVVAFEMIEHVADHERLLVEITRVLKPDGLLIISTPERRVYSSPQAEKNPFHVRELDLSELRALLAGSFAHAELWGQRTITGSALSALEAAGSNEAVSSTTFFIEPEGDGWSVAPAISPLYLVAVASDAPLPAIPRESTLADCDLVLMRDAERRGAEELGRVHEDTERSMRELREALAARDAHLVETQRGLAQMERDLGDRETELLSRRHRLSELASAAQDAEARAGQLEAEMAEVRRQTQVVLGSVAWRAFWRGRRRLLEVMGGHQALPARGARAARRLIRQPQSGSPADQPKWPTITFPEFEQPRVSIVIPLYSGARLTANALRSILDRTSRVSYEVILIDDSADAETKEMLRTVNGAVKLVNDQNIGYLRSVNRAAAHARGEWLVLGNNDIEVLDDWLHWMLACGDSADDIAIVTPKYLDADWRLSEAGGVIWRDGTGGNYGRGGDPSDYRYEYRREVDYGSAAALMVRTSFWRGADGFDERYVPMYYEDTDLCFRAREQGFRVIYEPRANVVHIEGGTAGTDVTTGHKRWQEINRVKFVQRWESVLEEQLPPMAGNAYAGANRHRSPHLLIVDHRVPMWDRDSGSLRLRGMIDVLLAAGWGITLLPNDRHMVLPYTQDLQELGVEVMHGDFDPVSALEVVAPSLSAIITCRPHATTQYLDLLRGLAPAVPVIYDTVDLHWLRESRRDALVEPGGISPRATALREIELALIRATDATLVVSEAERQQVEADVPGARVQVVANVNPVQAEVPAPRGRRGVVFVGGFEHPPNVAAALMLVAQVMPLVWREIPDVPVKIVGGSAPEQIAALASPRVEILGWVPEIGPVLDQARALVAPMTYGAGLKGKVTQALAAGLPVVTTPVGAEGLDADDGSNMLVADDVAGLAERVVRVMRDDDLWHELSTQGQKLAAATCSPELAGQRLIELLGELGVATMKA